MNNSDVAWMEKLFKQHKEDQQHYLDDKFASVGKKFETINKKLDDYQVNCEKCRVACRVAVDSNIKEIDKNATKKVFIGSAVAVLASILLWALFGTDALKEVLTYLGKLSVAGM